ANVARCLDQSAFLCHNTHRFALGLNRTFIWLSPKFRRKGSNCRKVDGTHSGRRNMTFPAALKSSLARLMAVGLLSAIATGFAPAAATASAHSDTVNSCRLSNDSGIQHVIYVQFDNTHFKR